MKLILKKCHRFFYLGVVILFYVLLYPLLYFYSRKTSRFHTLNHVRRFYSLISSVVAGFIFRYHHREKIDWTKTYIICANHTSNLDVPAITMCVKGNFAFLGKEELLDNPLLRLFFKTIDIPLNRDSRISSFRAFKKGEEYLKQGMSLVIFPEGKIGDDYPPILHEFKNGPFRLAIEQKVPIIPVSMGDNWKKMWDDGTKYGTSPGICDICVHKPIQTAGLSLEDAEDLKQQVYSIIQSAL
jgi:1-acyl-sn-glycerol-3-phosphate acyltransferase